MAQNCNAFGCPIQKGLLRFHRGKFCKEHVSLLKEIRDEIKTIKQAPWSKDKISTELGLREKEAQIRPLDQIHLGRILDLQNVLDDMIEREAKKTNTEKQHETKTQ